MIMIEQKDMNNDYKYKGIRDL